MFLTLSPSTRLKGFVLEFVSVLTDYLDNLLTIKTNGTSESTVLVPLISAQVIYIT